MTDRVLVLLPPEWEARIVSEIGQSRSMHVSRRCVDLPDLLAAAAAGIGTTALVSAAVRGLDRSSLSDLESCGLAVVGVVSGKGHDEEDRLRRLGVARVIRADASAQEVARAATVARAEGSLLPRQADPGPPDGERREPAPGSAGPALGTRTGDEGEIIAVWGPTGAPGRSSVALNLAAELSSSAENVLLIDADPYGGTVAPALALLDEAPGVLSAIRHAEEGSLTIRLLAQCAVALSPRWYVLTGSPSGHRWPELRPAGLELVLAVARRWVTHVVVDCGFCLDDDEELSYDTVAPRRNGATLSVLAAADDLVVVGSADPIGLQRLVRGLIDVTETAPAARRHVVANRVRTSAVGSKPEQRVLKALSRFAAVEDATLIPEDRDAYDAAMLRGVPLRQVAPASPARRRIAELAEGFLASRDRSPRAPAPRVVAGGRVGQRVRR